MLFFLRDQNGSLVYLLKNNQYTVGRKDCNILISNDQSISRKHALLIVKDNKVMLCDCGSRYNTFLDDSKIEAETEIMLMNGNIIRFGRLQSIYTFNITNLITTTSTIKSNQKAILKNNINFLGGSIVQNWNAECTHVTVEQIILTVKVLCAIINGTPIVKLKYWDDYVDCVKNNLPAPNFNDYTPPCSEMILNYQNISLEFREERKTLFKNKVFVFPAEEEKARMVEMIKLAGGEAIAFDTDPISRSVIKDSLKEYLIMVTETPSNNLLQDLANYISELGKRTIPLQEIALAIITCSCEKDCNPNFDRKGTVLQAKTQTQKQTVNILAQETQSQPLFIMDTQNLISETVIPTSLKTDLDFNDHALISSTQNVTTHSLKESANDEPFTTNVKREGDSIDDLNAAKKIKIDITHPTPLFTKNRQKKDVKNAIETSPEPAKEDEKPSGKVLFAFKKAKTYNENVDPEPKNVINPFAKKRKATQSEDENQAKKSTLIIKDASMPSTSKCNSALIENPFANILKSKTPKTSVVAPISQSKPTTKKAQNNFASSTLTSDHISNLHMDLSAIERVDSSLEKSCGWISKSNCNSTVTKQISKVNGFADEVEEELMKYIDSFKNTVVIEEESMIVKKPTARNNNNDSSVVNNDLKNFKTFKKVQPLKVQTTIIPEAKYLNIVCNEKSAIPVEESDSEDEPDMNTQANTTKRKGKRFNF